MYVCMYVCMYVWYFMVGNTGNTDENVLAVLCSLLVVLLLLF